MRSRWILAGAGVVVIALVMVTLAAMDWLLGTHMIAGVLEMLSSIGR